MCGNVFPVGEIVFGDAEIVFRRCSYEQMLRAFNSLGENGW